MDNDRVSNSTLPLGFIYNCVGIVGTIIILIFCEPFYTDRTSDITTDMFTTSGISPKHLSEGLQIFLIVSDKWYKSSSTY